MIQAYKGITYSLIKSNRKTMSIYVERNGKVLVRAPKILTIDKINKIIELKNYWIHKSISELKELNKSKIRRQVVNGEGFLFLGKSYRLKIDKKSKKLSLKNNFFIINPKEIKKAKRHFINFYKTKGESLINKRVKYYKKKLGVEPKRIRIRELKNRWASRGSKTLNFHWKIVLAPISIIDYIIVHELAHYIKPNHSDEFWEIVESVMPDYNKRKDWLKINGAGLDI